MPTHLEAGEKKKSQKFKLVLFHLKITKRHLLNLWNGSHILKVRFRS